MLHFKKFHRLTYKIENLIINDLKKNEPIKYWTFWLLDLTAKISIFGLIFAILAIITIKYWINFNTEVSEYFIENTKKLIIYFGFIGVISIFFRTYFYYKLENIILDIFNKIKNQ
ncbi:hypothetical protein [Arsenophonus sp.]|uniref:hypothetical protein n=1 Tax=Arsenophonus sp. TaxID=1872640 RepID=UPI00286324C9|nr:hypothetical protein [Arsenophonus sp.]MDR5617817.1 hypothetical protein [Arsenophonus sp.]